MRMDKINKKTKIKMTNNKNNPMMILKSNKAKNKANTYTLRLTQSYNSMLKEFRVAYLKE